MDNTIASASFLDSQLPDALLAAAHTLQPNSGNQTAASAGQPLLDVGKVWSAVGGSFPLANLWSFALLLSILAIVILGLLLTLTWKLARASLSLYTRHAFSYGQNGQKTRILRLPSSGFILVCLLLAGVCQTVMIIQWEMKGRIFYFVGQYSTLQAGAFISLWMAGLAIILGRIRNMPLIRTENGASGCEDRPTSHRLDKPILHPLTSDAILLLLPIAICAAPAFMTLISVVSSTELLNSLLTSPSPQSSPSDISNGIMAVIEQTRLQGYTRSASMLALLLVLLLVETKAFTRLEKLASWAEETASRQTLADDERDKEMEKAEYEVTRPHYAKAPSLLRGLSRTSSLSRASMKSYGSKGSHQSLALSSHQLHMLPELDMQLPSPSLLRDDHFQPSTDMDHDLEDARSTYSRPSHFRRERSWLARASSPEQEEKDYDYVDEFGMLHYAPDFETLSKDYHESYALPPSIHRRSSPLPLEMVRSQTASSTSSRQSGRSKASSSSSRSSCSCTSSSKGSLRSFHLRASYAQQSYDGPSKLDLLAQRRSMAVDAGLLASLLVLLILLEAIYAALAQTIMDSQILLAGFEMARMLLQIVPVLVGLIVQACKGSQTAYGWQ